MKKTGILLLTIISLFFFLINDSFNLENIKEVEAETELFNDSSDTYTIEFNSNGGTGTMEKVTAKIDESYILTNKFSREYYTFIGWSTSQTEEPVHTYV